MNDQVEAFWETFGQTEAGIQRSGQRYATWYFGDSSDMASDLAALVMAGKKTATCSLLWEYEFDKEELPRIGELSVITDGEGAPLCIIETTEVVIKPYDQVDESFAFDEGEGDQSLAYWREVHWHFFGRSCERIGRELNQAMPLICERFRLIYSGLESEGFNQK